MSKLAVVAGNIAPEEVLRSETTVNHLCVLAQVLQTARITDLSGQDLTAFKRKRGFMGVTQ